MMQNQSQDLHHLPIAARSLEQMLLQPSEGVGQIDEGRAIAQGAGAPTKTHVLNLLHRLVDGKPAPAAIEAPRALTLSREPRADVQRYDALRATQEGRQ